MCLNKNLFLPNSSSIVAFTNEGRYQIVSDLTDVYIFLIAIIRFGIPYDVFFHVRSELEK